MLKSIAIYQNEIITEIFQIIGKNILFRHISIHLFPYCYPNQTVPLAEKSGREACHLPRKYYTCCHLHIHTAKIVVPINSRNARFIWEVFREQQWRTEVLMKLSWQRIFGLSWPR